MVFISKYEKIYANNGTKIPLLEELESIKNGTYKIKIEKCRNYLQQGNIAAYKKCKLQLPSVTFCGIFGKARRQEELVSYNDLLIIDIDNLPETLLHKQKKILISDPYIYAAWISPSGYGLKALVKINGSIEEHKSRFQALQEYFEEQYDIKIDRSGSDYTRSCFTSWDEDLYLNEDSTVYLDKKEVFKNIKKSAVRTGEREIQSNFHKTEGYNKSEDRKIIQKIITYLKRRNLSITGSYDNWFKVAQAISNTFTYELGERYFITFCELDGVNHDALKSRNLLRSCYQKRRINTSDVITLGTIIHFAKNVGFK